MLVPTLYPFSEIPALPAASTTGQLSYGVRDADGSETVETGVSLERSFTKSLHTHPTVLREMGKKARRTSSQVNRENFATNTNNKLTWDRFKTAHTYAALMWDKSKKDKALCVMNLKPPTIRNIISTVNRTHLGLTSDLRVSATSVMRYG